MRNPTRRNRNIGKTQGGRVVDGKPWVKWSRVLSRDVWEDLSEHDGPCRFFVENPSRKFFHPCKPNDYSEVLQQLPQELVEPIKAIVLRRTPTLDFNLGVDARKRFNCIILNSFPKSMKTEFSRKVTKGSLSHYEPWCSKWLRTESGWELIWNKAELRHYFRYHLFLHEIGHFHQPWTNQRKIREAFAENFALEWARKLGAI